MSDVTILVVDDESRMRKLIRDFLVQKNYNIIEAQDGEEALKIYNENKNKIKLILLDVMMPKLDGWSVLRQIRQENKTIPIIMLLTTLGAIIPSVAFLAKPLIDFNLFIISTFSQNSWAVFDLPVSDPRIFLVYIPVIIIFIWLKRRTKYDFRPRYTLEKSREYGKIYSC